MEDFWCVVDDGRRCNDTSFESGAIDESFERRASLSHGLCRSIEDGDVVAVAADECANFVCLRIDGDESAVGAIGNGYFGGFARVVEFGDANEPSLSRFERFFERFFFSLSWRRRVGEDFAVDFEEDGIAVDFGDGGFVVFIFFVF